jgi:hypothetical protein
VNNHLLTLFFKKKYLELVELLGSTHSLGNLDNVETNGLGKRTALTNGNNVTTRVERKNKHVNIWMSKAW